MISPKKIMEDIKQVRKEIHYLYNKYEQLEDGDPSKLDIGDKLNNKFEEASRNYNNVLAMLPLAIEDIKTRLLYGRSQEEASKNAQNIQIGILTMGEHGELKIIEAPKNESSTALMVMDEQRNNSLVAARRRLRSVDRKPILICSRLGGPHFLSVTGHPDRDRC